MMPALVVISQGYEAQLVVFLVTWWVWKLYGRSFFDSVQKDTDCFFIAIVDNGNGFSEDILLASEHNLVFAFVGGRARMLVAAQDYSSALSIAEVDSFCSLGAEGVEGDERTSHVGFQID